MDANASWVSSNIRWYVAMCQKSIWSSCTSGVVGRYPSVFISMESSHSTATLALHRFGGIEGVIGVPTR